MSKYETIGIFASVAVMAIALAVIRFETNVFTVVDETSSAQTGTVVVAGTDERALEAALTESVSQDGTVTKLVIDDVRVGSGPQVKVGDTVSVHYIGTLRDGTQFDNSYVRNEPFSFTVGDGRVIRGWEEGLVGMQPGGRRILVVPPDMGYANRVVGPIPANSTLIFSVELLEIKP